MTNDTITTGSGTSASTVLTTEAPSASDDPRPLFASAVRIGGGVVAAVRPDQLAGPTPCAKFDVRTLLDHMVMVLRRVAAMGRGDDPFGPDVLGSPPVADDGWPVAWVAAAQAVEEAWADDWALARIVRLPWMEGNGATTLVVYLNELTVHTWDLAVATRQRPTWDTGVLALAFDGIRFLPPGDLRREQGQDAGRLPGLVRSLCRRGPHSRRRPPGRPPGRLQRARRQPLERAAAVVSAP